MCIDYTIYYLVLNASTQGGPYPIVFIMELLIDRYKGVPSVNTSNGKDRAAAALTLEPGETINRAAFKKLWPDVVAEVSNDARIESLTRTLDGKLHVCWKLIGGEEALKSTHLKGDFPTDDFGYETAHSKSSYTPAKVECSGVSFL